MISKSNSLTIDRMLYLTRDALAFLLRYLQPSRREERDCRRRHKRSSEPPKNIGGETVHVFTHESLTTRHSHNDKKKRRCSHTIDHCHQDEQSDWIDVQKTE